MHRVLVIAILFFTLAGCGESDTERKARLEQEAQWEADREKSRKWAEEVQRNREAGAKALAEVDSLIRSDIEDRRSKLLDASVDHQMSSGGSVRTDIYTVRDGRVVGCTTTVHDTGPVMNCDGEP
jgi:hypothetical protein